MSDEEKLNFCPDSCVCKRAFESVSPLTAFQSAFLIKSLNSEDLIILQLISEFSLACGSENVVLL